MNLNIGALRIAVICYYKRTKLYIEKELPDFWFVDLNGKKRKFSEFRGKYILLDLRGYWCPPCHEELPYLQETYKRFQARELEIVGMNTNEFTPEFIKNRWKKTVWLRRNFAEKIIRN